MKRIGKIASASLLAAAMLTTSTVAFIAPMTASAGQMLGETTFDKKGLPWHTCQTNPASQTFDISNGSYNVKIVNPGGKARGGESRWDLQFRHRGLKIQSGHTYKLHWEVTASNAGNLATQIATLDGSTTVVWHNNASDFGQGWNNVQISKGKNSFDSTFTATKDIEVGEWAFHYGGAGEWQPADCFPEGTTLSFDNMSLECTTCGDTYTEGSCNWDPSNTLGIITPKSAVRVNQVGYYSNLEKKATYVVGTGEDYKGPAISDFSVVDSTGKAVYTGKAAAAKEDSSSGENVQVLDFSDFKTPGTYKIKCGDITSFEFTISDDIYKGVLTDALNYYYQNRSGVDITADYITSYNTNPKYKQSKDSLAHKAGHNPDTAYVQPKWVKSYAGVFDGDKSYSIDGTGGWYDAGDHGKYVVNGGISVWTLQNMYELSLANGTSSKFNDGGEMVIPENSNKVPNILDETKVELDWFFKMIVKSDDPYWGKYEGLVYHKLHDHKWTGLACRPADYETEWKTTRIVKPPSFAATLNLAATAAQAARLWKGIDDSYSATCLANAKLCYEAAKKNFYPYTSAEATNDKSLYAPLDQSIGGGAYGDTEVTDDFYWAACELYATTGDASYYTDLKGYKDALTVTTNLNGGENSGSFSSFNWGCTASLGTLSLYLSKNTSDADKATISASIKKAGDTYVAQENSEGFGVPYKGATFEDAVNIGAGVKVTGYEWGSNSFVVNNAMVMAYAYQVTKDSSYLNGVSTALDYIFGRNANDFSYVTGYGTYHLENPHHRLWSYELDKTFPKAPNGVMSGGPGSGMQDPYIGGLGYKRGDLAPQKCYVDSIEAWSVNEVTINWNAPFAWVISYLDDKGNDSGSSTPSTDPTTPTTPSTSVTLWGDANCDGKVDISDVVAVRRFLVNSTKFPLTAQGQANADVQNNGGGINAQDAVGIQQKVFGVITSLPIA